MGSNRVSICNRCFHGQLLKSERTFPRYAPDCSDLKLTRPNWSYFIPSQNLVEKNVCLTLKKVEEEINILRGACTIVYPMNLPPHDPIRLEFENKEDLGGTQDSLSVRRKLFNFDCNYCFFSQLVNILVSLFLT